MQTIKKRKSAGSSFRKIEDMNGDELYGSIRLAGDVIGRVISELEGYKSYLEDCLSAGKENMDVVAAKNVLDDISLKARKIHKQAWLALLCMAKLYNVKVINDTEIKK